MPKHKLRLPTSVIITLLLTLGLSISAQNLLAAWTSPSVSPPNGTISGLLNVGSASQAKVGSLTIGGNILTNSSIILRENPGTEPATYTQLYAVENIEVGPDSFTKLLIHSDTTNGDTGFTDSSINSHAIGRQGGVIHSTAVAPEPNFGATSMYFDGAGDYLEIADSDDWDFGSNDFTIDFWINPSGQYDNLEVMGINNFNHQEGIVIKWYAADRLFFDVYDSDSSKFLSLDDITIPTGAWTHLAFVRNGSNFHAFVNGSHHMTKTYSGSLDYQVGFRPRIGAYRSTFPNMKFFGYMDEIRISKGIARWTNDFTPPSAPYGGDTESGLVFKNSNGTETIIGSGGVTATDAFFADSGGIISVKDSKDFQVDGDIGVNTNPLSEIDIQAIDESSYIYLRTQMSAAAEAAGVLFKQENTNKGGIVWDEYIGRVKIFFPDFNDNRLVIDSTGRIGINTDNPQFTLDVNGKIRMQTQTAAGDADDIVATKKYVDDQAPITCIGDDRALQFDGTNWLCSTVSAAGASCAADSITWGSGSSCYSTVGAESDGTSKVVVDNSVYVCGAHDCGSYDSWTGHITAECNDGSWAYSGASCVNNSVNCSGCSCFVSGTKIAMSNGALKSIEEIEENEFITNELGEKDRVIEIIAHSLGARNIYVINDKVETTGDHPFASNDGWKVASFDEFLRTQSSNVVYNDIKATQLSLGDVLITKDGEEVVKTIKSIIKPYDELVYTLKLESGSRYYANGYLVASTD